MKATRSLCLMVLLTFLCCTRAGATSLDGIWKFRYCKDAAAADSLVQAGFYETGFDATLFDDLTVPSNWALMGYEEPVYRGFKDDIASEGLYIKDFRMDGSDTEKRVLLHFGGVWESCELWINSKYVGRHDGGYTSFTFDVSQFVDRNGSNRLAVRVRQVCPTYKFDTFDDWTLGGIYRPVSIETTPDKLYIDHVQTSTHILENGGAQLTARVFVTDLHTQTRPGNYPSPGKPYVLKAVLTDRGGAPVAEAETAVRPHVGNGCQTDLCLTVDNPLLWNAETPNLYDLTVYLLPSDKSEAGHVWRDRIGLREVTTSKDGKPALCINGQRVVLRGVNYHNEHPSTGRATTREIWLDDLKMMKETNINYLRLCHYPHAEEFMRLCDSLGFYCSEEVSLGGAGTMMYDPSNSGAVLQRTYETVSRDLNRPCVIVWSVGNEDAFTPLHQAALRACKAFDPTRPRLIPWRYENTLPMDDIDILSVHYWHPRECDSLAAQANRPVISTEYTHAFGEMGMGGLDQRFRAFTKHPQGAGAAIWMWQDQGLWMPYPLEEGKDNIMRKGDAFLRLSDAGWDGIMDSWRNPTRDWYEAREVYNPVYPATDTLSADEGGKTVTFTLMNGYDFIDMSTVSMDWESFDGRGKRIGNGSMRLPSCAPHCGTEISLPCSGKVEFYHLAFIHNDGWTIGKRSLTVLGDTQPRGRKSARIDDDAIRSILQTMRPCVWRRPDNSEESVIGKKLIRKAPKNWDNPAINELPDGSLEFAYNDSNKVVFSYTLTPCDGSIRVDYTVKPTLSVPVVPVMGVTLTMPDDMKDLRWRGLGPADCWSNKYRAGLDGVWTMKNDATPGVSGSLGTKRCSWVETCGYHIDTDGYIETDGNVLRLLIGVAARPEKGRKANNEFPEFHSDKNSPAHQSHFTIWHLGTLRR